MRTYFHNAICILLLICSKIQPDNDSIVSKHVAVWILYKDVFDGHLLILYFIVQHNCMHNFIINSFSWKSQKGHFGDACTYTGFWFLKGVTAADWIEISRYRLAWNTGVTFRFHVRGEWLKQECIYISVNTHHLGACNTLFIFILLIW